jgi:hypothetical protein
METTEESSFETLESLATLLCRRVIKHFIYAYTPFLNDLQDPRTLSPASPYSQVRIRLEKPCAVILADAPLIELTRSSNPYHDEDAKILFAEWEQSIRSRGQDQTRIPFPLQGTLSSWIALQEALPTSVGQNSALSGTE